MRFDDNYGADPNYVGSCLKPTKLYQDVKDVAPSLLARSLTMRNGWEKCVTSKARSLMTISSRQLRSRESSVKSQGIRNEQLGTLQLT